MESIVRRCGFVGPRRAKCRARAKEESSLCLAHSLGELSTTTKLQVGEVHREEASGLSSGLQADWAEKAVEPTGTFVAHMLDGANLTPEIRVVFERLLSASGLNSQAVFDVTVESDVPAQWPSVLRALVQKLIGQRRGVSVDIVIPSIKSWSWGEASRLCKRRRATDDESDSEDSDSSGEFITVARAVRNPDGKVVPVQDKESALVAERDQRPCFRLMSKQRYEALFPLSGMDAARVVRVLSSWSYVERPSTGDRANDFATCYGLWLICSLPVVCDRVKLVAGLRMCFSEEDTVGLRLQDFSKEPAWRNIVGKEVTDRGEMVLLTALENLQQFCVTFFGPEFEGCLRPFCHVFVSRGRPLQDYHDVFVEYTLHKALSQLGDDLASASKSLNSFPAAKRSCMMECLALFRAYGERWAFRMARISPSIETVRAAGLQSDGVDAIDLACLSRLQQAWPEFRAIPHGVFYERVGAHASFVNPTRTTPATAGGIDTDQSESVSNHTLRESGTTVAQTKRKRVHKKNRKQRHYY